MIKPRGVFRTLSWTIQAPGPGWDSRKVSLYYGNRSRVGSAEGEAILIGGVGLKRSLIAGGGVEVEGPCAEGGVFIRVGEERDSIIVILSTSPLSYTCEVAMMNEPVLT